MDGNIHDSCDGQYLGTEEKRGVLRSAPSILHKNLAGALGNPEMCECRASPRALGSLEDVCLVRGNRDEAMPRGEEHTADRRAVLQEES